MILMEKQEELNGYLSLFHGEAPTYEIYKTKADETRAIIRLIIELKRKGLNIMILLLGVEPRILLEKLKPACIK